MQINQSILFYRVYNYLMCLYFNTTFSSVMQWQSHCFAFSGLGYDPGKNRDLIKNIFLPGTRRDSGADSKSLASVPNTPGLNL